MAELYNLSITEAHDLLTRRELSAVDLTRAVLDRVASVDPRVRSYVTVTEEAAMATAADADATIAAGNAGPLTGIPACIKDVIATRGVKTTCSSRMLQDFVPPYDATVMQKLNAAGAVMILSLIHI